MLPANAKQMLSFAAGGITVAMVGIYLYTKRTKNDAKRTHQYESNSANGTYERDKERVQTGAHLNITIRHVYSVEIEAAITAIADTSQTKPQWGAMRQQTAHNSGRRNEPESKLLPP